MTQSASNSSKKIGAVLTKLLDQHHLGAKDNDVIILKIDTFIQGLDLENTELLQALTNLKEKKIIKSWMVPFEKALSDEDAINTCYVTLPTNFRAKSEKLLKEISVNEIASSGLILYLDKTGRFWHGDKTKTYYPMEVTGGRFKLIKYLAENEGLQLTETIAYILGAKGKRSTMNEIGKIKAELKKRLKLSDIIKNERPLGYRIDPKYKVVITD